MTNKDFNRGFDIGVITMMIVYSIILAIFSLFVQIKWSGYLLSCGIFVFIQLIIQKMVKW